MVPDVPAGAGDLDELAMPGPRSGMKPIRDGSKFGGIVHAVDATVIPQASERSNVAIYAILSTYVYKSHLIHEPAVPVAVTT